MERCLNIDWLEIYCLEDSLSYPHNADFFRACGFPVEERQYGTPMYEEMFTIIAPDNKYQIEIRRKPKKGMTWDDGGIFDPYSCHLRLTNQSCYLTDCVKILQEFIERFGIHYQRISRIDLCLDFEVFDSGDMPAKFIRRYLNGKYSKVNQTNINAHGADRWEGRDFNSLSWGAKTSMVSTKLYDKTKELAEVRDKPYIRQQWFLSHLVDDPFYLTKQNEQGEVYKPRIFRLEFSVKSSVKNWMVIEDNSGSKQALRSIRNDLSCYLTKQQQLDVFFSLANHYFHFKKYKQGVRKDRCADKVLFKPDEVATWYQVDRCFTAESRQRPVDSLLTKLYQYRDSTSDNKLKEACNTLIEAIEQSARLHDLVYPFSASELTIMRNLISLRLKRADMPVNDALESVKAQVQVYQDIFGELQEI